MCSQLLFVDSGLPGGLSILRGNAYFWVTFPWGLGALFDLGRPLEVVPEAVAPRARKAARYLSAMNDAGHEVPQPALVEFVSQSRRAHGDMRKVLGGGWGVHPCSSSQRFRLCPACFLGGARADADRRASSARSAPGQGPNGARAGSERVWSRRRQPPSEVTICTAPSQQGLSEGSCTWSASPS